MSIRTGVPARRAVWAPLSDKLQVGTIRTRLGIEEQRHRDALGLWRERVRFTVRAREGDRRGGLAYERVHHRRSRGLACGSLGGRGNR